MSHEIWSPKVVIVETGEVLFDLQDGDIDADFTWLENGTFQMHLRRYSREVRLDVWVDVPGRTFRINTGEPRPIEEAEKSILKALPWRN
jgi:hypothetical protein